MFGHLFKYHILQALRNISVMFWTALFPPLILGNLFYITFGNINEGEFHTIPVAYVEEEAGETHFSELLEELEQQENPLVTVTKTDMETAEEMLKGDEIEGIFLNGKKISLVVKEEAINESILKMVLDEYEKKHSVINTIAEHHPEQLESAMDRLEQGINILQEEKTTDGNMNAMITYFYALIAMSCLYGSFQGMDCALRFKGNISDIGARRVVASTNRFVILLTDVGARILLQFICSCIALLYLTVVLKVDMGNQIPRILLVILAGDTVGVMTGMFIGSVGRVSGNVKQSISLAITMLECFLSGLMVGGMYYIVEKYVPVINRINPASLIVDAFYSLNIYDTYERYTGNVVSLLVIAIILCIGSYLAVRRERYASL